MYESNGTENDGILWLNEKHIEGLDHKHLWEFTIKYSDHRTHSYELVDEPKNNPIEFLQTKN